MTKKEKLTELVDYAYGRLCDIGTWVKDYGGPVRFQHEFRANTKYGKLRLTLSPDYIATGQEVKITVFTQFEEPQRAIPNLYAVGRTGKWNWHGLNKEEFDSLFEKLKELRTEHEII